MELKPKPETNLKRKRFHSPRYSIALSASAMVFVLLGQVSPKNGLNDIAIGAGILNLIAVWILCFCKENRNTD